MDEEPERCGIFDLMLHILEMMGGSQTQQRMTGMLDTIKGKAEIWKVPEKYHDTFIRAVLGAHNLGQILAGLNRIVGACEEMGAENPVVDPIMTLIEALKACLLQGFQTVRSMVKDIPVEDVDEFMFEIGKEIAGLMG